MSIHIFFALATSYRGGASSKNICISFCSRNRATSSCSAATCVRRFDTVPVVAVVLVRDIGDTGTSMLCAGGTGSVRVSRRLQREGIRVRRVATMSTTPSLHGLAGR